MSRFKSTAIAASASWTQSSAGATMWLKGSRRSAPGRSRSEASRPRRRFAMTGRHRARGAACCGGCLDDVRVARLRLAALKRTPQQQGPQGDAHADHGHQHHDVAQAELQLAGAAIAVSRPVEKAAGDGSKREKDQRYQQILRFTEVAEQQDQCEGAANHSAEDGAVEVAPERSRRPVS